MAQDVVMEVLLVVYVLDDLIKAFGARGSSVFQRTDRQALSHQELLVEGC